MHFPFLFLLLGMLLTSTSCCPDACNCGKEVIDCTGNITEVPSVVSPHIILLRLIGAQISELGERSLYRWPGLLGLDVSRNQVKTIHPAAFRQTLRLRSLKLSYNKLSTLSGQVFANLTDLSQLFLRGNKIEMIPPGLFNGLTQLTLLDLSDNRLAHLDEDVFQDLKNLIKLDLGKNFLRGLPVSLLRPLAQLSYLRLYFNQLESLRPGIFNSVPNLLELDLFNNNISQLAPRLFWNLPKLTKLTLSRNKLQTIPAQSFHHLPQISFLSIYINPLATLPDQLIGLMPNLKEFYLYETELEALPENLFCNVTALEILSISFNKRLQILPKGIFSCLSGLRRLKLQANSLQCLHQDLFSGMINLDTLILSSNKLHALPNDLFLSIPRLTNLSLDNNQFQSLPVKVLSVAAVLKKVTLTDNPWQCICDILDFVTWMQRMQSVIEDYEYVLCHSPPHLQNVSLGSLSPEAVHCWDPTTETTPLVPALTSNSMREAGREAWSNTPAEPSRTNSRHPSSTSQVPQTFAEQHPQEGISSTELWPLKASTSTELRPQEGSSISNSPAFYDAIILEPEDHIVHHNRRDGWVYLWTLPPSGPYLTFLVVVHIGLVATGMALIVASACLLCRLNQAMEQAAHKPMQEGNRTKSGRRQRFSDEL